MRRNVEFYNEFLEREFLLPSSCPSNSLMTPADREIAVLNPDNGTSSYVIAEIANELEAEKCKVVMLRHDVERKEQEVATVDQEMENISSKVDQKTVELKRARTRETYYRRKTLKLEEEINENKEDEKYRKLEEKIKITEQENQELRRQLTVMEYERKVDHAIINEQQDNIVKLFDDSTLKYTPELQTCVHTLLSNHVSTTRVGPVIEACLKLVGKIPDRLPSVTTINSMNIQRLILAQKQLSEEISQKETDETSKFGTKFEVYAIRDSEGNPYVLG